MEKRKPKLFIGRCLKCGDIKEVKTKGRIGLKQAKCICGFTIPIFIENKKRR